jgi:hypothetical protein
MLYNAYAKGDRVATLQDLGGCKSRVAYLYLGINIIE